MTADARREDTLHETSLAVWDIPRRDRGGRALRRQGRREVVGRLRARRLPHRGAGWRGGGGAPAVSAMRRGPAPTRCSGPRSSCARRTAPGLVTLCGALRRGELDEPHRGRVVAVQRRRSSPARTHADGDGRRGRHAGRGGHRPPRALSRDHRRGGAAPRIKLAKGRYELVVWKAGYDTTRDAAHDRRRCLRARSMRARCRRTIPTRSGRHERRDIGAGLLNRKPP